MSLPGAGTWPNVAEFEAWWRRHVREFNAMAADPRRRGQWETWARAVEAFQVKHDHLPRTDAMALDKAEPTP